MSVAARLKGGVRAKEMNTIEYIINYVVFEFIYLVGVSIVVLAPLIFINYNITILPKAVMGFTLLIVIPTTVICARLSASARVYQGLTFGDALMLPFRLIKLKIEQVQKIFRK